MPLYVDQLLRKVHVCTSPQRIISVVPSQTELLYDLELDEEVIAITKFCVHPLIWFETKPRIGGTKNLNLQKIKELQPDLILANKEENNKKDIEELASHFPVWVSDVNTLSSAYAMIKEVGKIVNKEEKAEELLEQIRIAFSHYKPKNAPNKLRTVYLIWKEPYMTIGSNTFIHEMLSYGGFENIFSDKSRYPEIDATDLIGRNCQVVLLSSEPYPFQAKHVNELKALLPDTKILLADGELFSWYGSRMLQAPEYFKNLYREATQ